VDNLKSGLDMFVRDFAFMMLVWSVIDMSSKIYNYGRVPCEMGVPEILKNEINTTNSCYPKDKYIEYKVVTPLNFTDENKVLYSNSHCHLYENVKDFDFEDLDYHHRTWSYTNFKRHQRLKCYKIGEDYTFTFHNKYGFGSREYWCNFDHDGPVRDISMLAIAMADKAVLSTFVLSVFALVFCGYDEMV